MEPKTKRTILLMGNDANLGYLLGRLAEQNEYQLTVAPENVTTQDFSAANPVAVIFPSTELLDKKQTLIGELTSLEIPILVCSSVNEQARARELGADYCLLHPITYDDFKSALLSVTITEA
jgi:CheY-like chemotaxis protein